MDYKDDAIALVLMAGLIALCGGDATKPTSYPFLTGNLPLLGFDTLLTLHTLNQCQNRGKKHWLTDILECMLSVFASKIALGVLNGGNLGTALMLGAEKDYTLVIICWYLQNHSIGGVVPNIWDLITSSPLGPAIQKVLNLASIILINNLIIEAASVTVDAHEHNLTKIAITPLIKAIVVGTASAAIPDTSDTASTTATNALVLGLLVSTKGFATVPVVGAHVSGFLGKIPAPIGGSIEKLYTNLLVIRYFLGEAIGSIVPVPALVLDPLHAGVVEVFSQINTYVTNVNA